MSPIFKKNSVYNKYSYFDNKIVDSTFTSFFKRELYFATLYMYVCMYKNDLLLLGQINCDLSL